MVKNGKLEPLKTRVARIRVDQEGDGILVGNYRGEVIGLAQQPLINTNTEDDYFDNQVIVKVRGKDGQVIWVEDVECKGSVSLNDVVVDTLGNVIIAGSIRSEGTMEIGGVKVEGTGNYFNTVIAKLSGETKDIVWGPRVYHINNNWGSSIAVGILGEVYLAGDFYEKGDFGLAGKLNAGIDNSDGFLLKLRP